MIWAIVIVLVVGSLLALAVAAVPLVRRLGEFGVAARRLNLRVADAQRLLPAVTALQQRAEQIQHEVAAAQERVAEKRDAKR